MALEGPLAKPLRLPETVWLADRGLWGVEVDAEVEVVVLAPKPRLASIFAFRWGKLVGTVMIELRFVRMLKHDENSEDDFERRLDSPRPPSWRRRLRLLAEPVADGFAWPESDSGLSVAESEWRLSCLSSLLVSLGLGCCCRCCD